MCLVFVYDGGCSGSGLRMTSSVLVKVRLKTMDSKNKKSQGQNSEYTYISMVGAKTGSRGGW